MFVAAVVILILCSPLILGPLIIPARKRRKTEAGLERLYGKDERLPEGLTVLPTARPGSNARVYCDVQIDANLTKVDCGGRLHDVMEEAPGAPSTKLVTVCFLCGRFEKSAEVSQSLGAAFAKVDELPALERLIQYVKSREEHERRRSAA